MQTLSDGGFASQNKIQYLHGKLLLVHTSHKTDLREKRQAQFLKPIFYTTWWSYHMFNATSIAMKVCYKQT